MAPGLFGETANRCRRTGRFPSYRRSRVITGIDAGENVEMPAGFLPDRPGRIPKAGARLMPGKRLDNALVEADRNVLEKRRCGFHRADQ